MTPDPSEVADATLVAEVRSGDEQALEALYRRYVTAIYRFIQAQVRSAPDAEDLTSETFANMLRGIRDFRGDASFKNWLYQIARNAVRNHRRSGSYRLVVPLGGDVAVRSESEPTANPDALERALQVLRPLPPRYRRILELRFLEGRSIEDSAQAMGITETNAKVLQHRALKKAAALAEEPVELGRTIDR
jgi:RNA polymerase sigma-70 factor (ECF subfamily)